MKKFLLLIFLVIITSCSKIKDRKPTSYFKIGGMQYDINRLEYWEGESYGVPVTRLTVRNVSDRD